MFDRGSGAAAANDWRGMGERPRLLFVVNAAWFFASHRLPIAIAARDAGFDVHVAAAPRSGEDQLLAAGFPFHPLRLSRSSTKITGELRAICDLLSLYRSLQPDIVHHVTVKPVVYGSIVARLLGTPAVVNAISGLGTIYLATGWKALLRRSATVRVLTWASRRRAVWYIFQNRADQEEYVASGITTLEQSLTVQGSGVDLNEFTAQPASCGAPVTVLPARLLGDKGIREFVSAAKTLRARRPGARFILAGGLDPENPSAISSTELETWIAEGHVEWWGKRDDMPRVLSEAHVVCLPSYREGMPKVLLEAAACGRPIVTTDVPGCREVIGNPPIGLLVPPRDVEALTEALDTFIADEALRLEYGAAARARAESAFGVDDVVARTLALYAKAIKTP